jgi:alpha/beta superfamily hydrolase
VPEPSVAKLVSKLAHQRNLEIDYRVIPGANHFYHDNMEDLDWHISDYLSKVMDATPEQAAAAR